MSKGNIANEIVAKFGNRLRIRANGILIQKNKILLIKHDMGNDRILWSVPGGGMEFGQNIKSNLKREFKEETGLVVEVKDYLFVHEYLKPPLHALEHFFLVKWISGILKMGVDPELANDKQSIIDIQWMSIQEMNSLPKNSLHPMFWEIKSLDSIGLYKGYFNFENNSLK